MSIKHRRDRGGTRILRVVHGRDARATFATTCRSEVSTARGSGWVAHADQLTYISDLTAGFGIERSLIEHNFALIAFVQIRNFFIAADHGQHFRVIDSRGFVTSE